MACGTAPTPDTTTPPEATKETTLVGGKRAAATRASDGTITSVLTDTKSGARLAQLRTLPNGSVVVTAGRRAKLYPALANGDLHEANEFLLARWDIQSIAEQPAVLSDGDCFCGYAPVCSGSLCEVGSCTSTSCGGCEEYYEWCPNCTGAGTYCTSTS
jgi:hypothetical protein